MPNRMIRFLRDDAGLESVEYAVLTAVIVAVVIIALIGLAAALVGRYDAMSDVISGAGV